VQGSAALLEPPPIRGAGQAQGNWATMPPPPRSRSEHDTVIEALEAATALNETLPLFPALTAAPAEPAPSQPVDPIEEAARLSGAARRGLTTKRSLYYRVARTRQLLDAWDQVGICMNDPHRQLSTPTEVNAFTTQLRRVRELLRSF